MGSGRNPGVRILSREGADGRLAHLDGAPALQLSRLILVHLGKERLLKTSCEELKSFSWRRVMSQRGELPRSKEKLLKRKGGKKPTDKI